METIVNNETFSSGMAEAENYYKWILSLFRPYIGNSLLEVGIGHGEFCELLNDLNEYVGVDIDEQLIEQGRNCFPTRLFYHADIGTLDFSHRIEHRKFKTVLCINVLEHIDDDQLVIKNLLSSLESGGYLLLFVPAIQALYTSLDALAGHKRRYSKKDLIRVIPSDMGKVIRAEYFNAIGGIGWWMNNLFSHTSLESSIVKGQIKFFDKFVLPISRLVNFATKRFFGQSLICVIEKM